MKKGRTVRVAERLGKLLEEKLKPIKPHEDRLGGTQKLMIGFPVKQPLVMRRTASDKNLSCLKENRFYFQMCWIFQQRLSGVLKTRVGEANPSTMTVTPARPSNKHTSTNWLQELEPMDTHAWHDVRVTDAPKALHSPSLNHSRANKTRVGMLPLPCRFFTFSESNEKSFQKSQIPSMCSSTVGSGWFNQSSA